MLLTTKGMMEESLLQRLGGAVETDDFKSVSTEYCLIGCSGSAHQTGTPDADGHFCNQHVHRSVAVQMKRYPSMASEQGSFA